jgi:putative heme iron utilization protein
MTRPTSSAAHDDLRQQLADQPGGVLEAVAAQRGLPLQTVVECLPEAMWSRVAGTHFVSVMEDICNARPARPRLLQSPGRTWRLHGHLRADNCRTIVILRRPFMGKETASVQFFNADGEAMFKIFIGRDDKGTLRQEQIDHLSALQDRLAASAAA